MTVEIAIMNKEAIALAADSAVTIGRENNQKIFTSANKLFSLSKYQPVGIMIYGNAIFMGVPWETIIKIYRRKLGQKKFKTLKHYATDFINFLDNGNALFSSTEQSNYVKRTIYSYFLLIKENIWENIHKTFDKEGKISDTTIKQIVTKVIKKHYDSWKRADNIPSIPESFNRNIIKRHKKFITEIPEEIFEKLPITKSHLKKLTDVVSGLFSKFPKGIEKDDMSGIVIAGFGDNECFPALRSYNLEGIALNKLKYKKYVHGEISFDNNANIVPFAQSEMIATFMEGVDPFYREVEFSYLYKIFEDYANGVIGHLKKLTKKEKNTLKSKLEKVSEEILSEFSKKLDSFKKKNYITPITSVVSMLPKDELAAMAESLVNLTSFKRKVTMERETVGGPIDVAVISKGDGFVWIKRKHYFNKDLNPQFFANYYKEISHEKK